MADTLDDPLRLGGSEQFTPEADPAVPPENLPAPFEPPAPLDKPLARIRPGDSVVVPIPVDSSTVLEFTPKLVADLLCPGIPVTEALRILLLCRGSGVNPFTELFIDKRPNDRGRFDYNAIISKRAFLRLAAEHPKYRGYTYTDSPSITERPDGPPISGRCVVSREDCPEYTEEVIYKETITAVGAGGKPYTRTGFCITQPRAYLRLVTVARALRNCFPDRLNGLYVPGEF